MSSPAAEFVGLDLLPTAVVALPSWDRFAAQDEAYQQSVFPPDVPVLSVEAALGCAFEPSLDVCAGLGVGIDLTRGEPGQVGCDAGGVADGLNADQTASAVGASRASLFKTCGTGQAPNK